MNAKEFADSVGATVVFPTEPDRPISVWEPANVKATWDRFRPEPDFVTGKMTQQVWDAAPQSWRQL